MNESQKQNIRNKQYSHSWILDILYFWDVQYSIIGLFYYFLKSQKTLPHPAPSSSQPRRIIAT